MMNRVNVTSSDLRQFTAYLGFLKYSPTVSTRKNLPADSVMNETAQKPRRSITEYSMLTKKIKTNIIGNYQMCTCNHVFMKFGNLTKS